MAQKRAGPDAASAAADPPPPSEPGSGSLPCPERAAGAVRLGLPVVSPLAPADLVGSAVPAAWRGGQPVLEEIVRALEGRRRRIPAAVALQAVREAVAQGLVRVAEGAELPGHPGPDSLRLRRPEDVVSTVARLTNRDSRCSCRPCRRTGR